MKRFKTRLALSAALFAAFILWTLLVSFADVQAIGPQGSSVGLAGVNRFVHNLTGVHFTLYTITDWLGLAPICVCMGFAVLGLAQWIARMDIRKVDRSILALGGYYIAVMAAYLFFEYCVINYRPVLIDGYLEASYPSSTTMLVLCVMPTAAMQLNMRMGNGALKRAIILVIAAFTAFMVIGRLVSGVHWFSDIVGGMLFSGALVTAYAALARQY